MNRSFLWRKGPALACCLVSALFALAYFAANPAYRTAMLFLGNKAYWFPFLDTDTVMSAVRCLRADVDAYVFNPCDAQLRVFTYSPLWMSLTWLPVTEAWLPWMGLIWVLLFLGSLFLLPAARSRDGMALMIAGVVSSSSLYAMERGNNDIVIFAAVTAAAVLVSREGAARRLGYGLVLLAGLLKYYPLGVMVVALREPSRRFFTLAAVAIALTALAIFATWDDLIRVLKSIPVGQFFTDMYGAKSSGLVLVGLFHLPQWIEPVTRVVLSLGALGIGIRLGLGQKLPADLARLNERERMFLLIGALMACLCYFSAQNIGYRAINLILVLPALTALMELTGKRRYKWLSLAVLALLWTGAWRLLWEGGVMAQADYFAPERYVALILRDVLWWTVIPVLIGCIVALLRDGPIPKAVLEKVGLAKG